MNEQTTFSIIIPTYDRRDLVVKTIDSCLAQSYKNFEVIVVDDGGTDGTGSMVSDKFSSDPRVKYFWKENAERGEARNFGITKSSGEYLMFLDSDDLMEPNCLNHYHKNILDKDFPDVLFCKFRFLRNGKFVDSDVSKWKAGWYSWRIFLKGNFFASMICFKAKSNDIKVPGALDFVTSEDWMFNLFKTYNKKFFFVEELGFTMIEHNERSMNLDQIKIIRTKVNAWKFIVKNMDLSQADQIVLSSHVNFFVAIHSYVGGQRRLGMDHLKKVGKEISFVKKAILKLKLIIGRKTILKFKSIV